MDQPATTYAIPDIHGRLDLLNAGLQRVGAHASGQAYRLIFLGDYVDRGPDSRGVIERLVELDKSPDVTCLKGNHEQMMLDALEMGGRALRHWLANGGDATLQSYNGSTDGSNLAVVPAAHRAWLAHLPIISHNDHHVFVHAGLQPDTPLQQQDEDTCLWIRERFLRAPAAAFPAHVVHGHTPTWAGKPDPARPELRDHRTNLDTGAYATGVLTIGVYNAAQRGGPIELLTVTGPPAPEWL